MLKSTILRNLFAQEAIIRTSGVHDAISAKLSEKSGYDALWASGLAISTSHGLPDLSLLTMTEFLRSARIINSSSVLPVIADCDTGFGDLNNVMRMVIEYEQAGIAGVCIEDKEYPKRNSFLEGHSLIDKELFAAKLQAAQQAKKHPDFIVCARLESLIAGLGVKNALQRAQTYAKAGADAIVVHSKSKTIDEIAEFAHQWQQQEYEVPLIAIPTTYYSVTADELKQLGFKMVIYANQALRATIPVIQEILCQILEDGTTAAVENRIASIQEVFSLTKEYTRI